MKKFICLLIIVSIAISLNAQTDTSLQQYSGVYKFPEGSVVPSVEIKMENGGLMATSQMGSAALERISKDTFNLLTYNGTVFFTRDADSKVNGIHIEVQDIILEGKKESAGLAINNSRPWLWNCKIFIMS